MSRRRHEAAASVSGSRPQGGDCARGGGNRGRAFSQGRVEPEALAAHERIGFDYAAFPEEFDGVLYHEGGRFFIICNDRVHARGSARSRFTFAHELGHYFLQEHREALASGAWPAHYSRAEFASDSVTELEVDAFAASLLMPEAAFRREYEAVGGNLLDRVAAMAERFGTSITATAYRVLALELLPPPAALFRWDQCGRLVARRLSSETALLAREYRGLVVAPPAGSLTARAVEALWRKPQCGESHVVDWFPRLTGYGHRDQEAVIEHVQPLGQHGWLTLVHACSV